MPTRVLVLSRSESSVRLDMQVLRSLGVTALTHMSDSAGAVAFLEKEQEALSAALAVVQTGTPSENTFGKRKKRPLSSIDLVVCDDELANAPASSFLYSLAEKKALRVQPVLVLTGSPKTAREFSAAGICVLERPYTPEALRKAIQKALSPMRQLLRPENLDRLINKGRAAQGERQKPARPEPMTTSDWFKQGLAHLKRQDLKQAEYAFIQTLERNEDHVDASLGLVQVCRFRKDIKGVRRSLLRAAAACLRKEDKARAAAIAAALPVGMRGNVFMHEAISYLEEGAYRRAALSFLDAGRQSGDVPLHRVIARGCLLSARPEESMEQVCSALEGLGHKDTAAALRRRLLSYQPFERKKQTNWLDRYPMLKEAVSVAAYTVWIWKQA